MADAASAYLVVDGQTYHVLEQVLDDVANAVEAAVQKGTVVSFKVAAVHDRADDMGSGTLHLNGAQLGSVAVLSGPVSAGGMPIIG